MLFLDGDDSAYLFASVVSPRHRRRGIQRALTARRVQLALDYRVQVIGSEIGAAVPGEANPSWVNLRRAGLLPVATTEHLWPALWPAGKAASYA